MLSPYHEWGDTTFDWEALNDACRFFSNNLRRYGRISISGCKEKYGTMRLEWFCWGAHYNEFFHSLIKPGYLYVDFPVWFRNVDRKIAIVMKYLGVSWIIEQYQRLLFNIITIITVTTWS